MNQGGTEMVKKIVVFVFLVSFSTLFSQSDPRNDRIQQLTSIYGTQSAYRLGSGDLIEVNVYGVNDFRHDLRINSSGNVRIPLLGPIMVAGLTGAELEDKLAKLLDDGFIQDAQVSVFVKEYRSQPVFVLGAVRRPGQYQITLQLNFIDVLAMAGGLAPLADEVATIQRAHSGTSPDAHDDNGNSEPKMIEINLTDLLDEGELALNIPVQGGDVIHIPERELRVFYVIGDVGRPGTYELPKDLEVLVSQGLAKAGGPTRTAKMNSGILVRYDTQGTRQELAVNFSDILKGKRSDFPIQKNDVIFIPGSTAKEIGYGLLNIIPNTVSRAIVYPF